MPRLRLAVCLALTLASPGLAAPIPITGWAGGAHGQPLAGARVTLSPLLSAFERQRLGIAGTPTPEPIAKTVSDAAGTFTLTAPDAGMWTVRIEAAGAVPCEIDLVPLLEAVELPAFLTETAKADDTAGLDVRVVDGQGRPVPAARVTAEPAVPAGSADFWRPALRRGDTGADGRLRLPRRRDERLKLRASVAGFPLAESEAGEASAVLRLATALPRDVLVRGADGQPVAGALVAAAAGDTAAALTDEGGHARVFSRAKTIRPLAWTADGRRATAAPLPPDADPATPRTILLPSLPDRLSGQVVDRLDRHPLAGALVWPRQDPAGWVRADARGGYALAPFAATAGTAGMAPPTVGRTALAAAAPSHLPAELAVPPPGRGERALRVPTFALEPAVAAEGTIVDAAGKPLAGAYVSASAAASDPTLARTVRVRTGPDGHFALRPLAPAEPHTLFATLLGFVPAKLTLAEQKPLTVRSGLRLVLRRGTTLSGRVIDGRGQPVAAAVVVLATSSATAGTRLERTTADAAGHFAVEGLPAGELDLTVRAPGFAPTVLHQVTIPAGPAVKDLGPIALGAGLSLTGIVVDRDGQPVAAAAIRTQAERSMPDLASPRFPPDEAKSGADGRFLIPGLSRGPALVLTVDQKGFATRTLTGIKPPLREPLRIVLSPASRLAGDVVDDAGAPLAGARLGVRGELNFALLRAAGPSAFLFPSATADDDGHFELKDAPSGKLTLSARAPGFLPGTVPVELAPGASRDDLRVVLHRGATVGGRVVGPDGTPAVGAAVSLAGHGSFAGPTNSTASVDGDGGYVLDAVPPGPQTFQAALPGALPTVRDMTVRPGENRLDFQLGSGLEISGRVVDPAGAAVGGASVTLGTGEPLPETTTSGDDGSFRFPGLRSGTYQLSGRAEGFAAASEEVRLAEVALKDVELRLTNGGAVAGRIVGLSPEQLSQVRVSAFQTVPDFGGPKVEPDAQGEYRLSDLPPGDWTVLASLGLPGRSARGQVQLPPGVPEVRLDLEFPAGFTLSGRLLRAGQPLSGALVGASGSDADMHGTAHTDTQGNFRIEGLKAGTYQLTAYSVGTAGQIHKESIEITGDREVEIDLPALNVRGRVVDADDGSPVAEVAIGLEAVTPDPSSFSSGLPGPVKTGPDGTFVLEAVAEGDYQIVARKEGYAPGEAPVHLAAGGGADDVKVTLTPSAGLRFTVRDATGNPPASVSAALLDPSGRLLLAGNYPVADSGRVRISEAPAGHWLLLVSGSNSATATVAVDLPGAGPAVTLPDRSHLTILVPELAGKAAGAKLQITGADGLPYRSLRFGFLIPVQLISSGRLELDDLPPGIWQVRVEVPGGAVRQGSAVTAPGAPAQVVLQ
jgi:protocatechuate 3,4-dioxygenase beta subunit